MFILVQFSEMPGAGWGKVYLTIMRRYALKD